MKDVPVMLEPQLRMEPVKVISHNVDGEGHCNEVLTKVEAGITNVEEDNEVMSKAVLDGWIKLADTAALVTKPD